ncbi:hypothetical protein E2C01_053851 [Portunus trituberculatus]|uniref:Uncharacterized protein n=1 Tax=Portunus trituberculatus TaxID=210409 RepID=A0A5B7GQF1_PORTR|nr:hypothetical protein [Portunus trituberculatus]
MARALPSKGSDQTRQCLSAKEHFQWNYRALAADKVKLYIGHEDILLRERELYLPTEDNMEQEEENDSPRPRRERRLPLRYRDDEPGMARGNRPEDEVEMEENSDPEGEGEEDVVRYRRERRPVRRYVEDAFSLVLIILSNIFPGISRRDIGL